MLKLEGKQRWAEISSKIKVNLNLDKEKTNQLWELLDQFPTMFTWHDGELGCYKFGEHVVDAQGFSLGRTTPSRLSLWEKVEVMKQMDVLVTLGKMKPSSFEYTCRVTLLIKKDNNH
jgi:hypothetical protein